MTGAEVILDAVGRAFADEAALTSIAHDARVVSRTIKIAWLHLETGECSLDLGERVDGAALAQEIEGV